MPLMDSVLFQSLTASRISFALLYRHTNILPVFIPARVGEQCFARISSDTPLPPSNSRLVHANHCANYMRCLSHFILYNIKLYNIKKRSLFPLLKGRKRLRLDSLCAYMHFITILCRIHSFGNTKSRHKFTTVVIFVFHSDFKNGFTCVLQHMQPIPF